MTFDDIVADICDQLGFDTDPSAIARIGRALNKHYKRITSSVGVRIARQVAGVEAETTIGAQTLTFTGLEQIKRIYNDNDGSVVGLDELTYQEIRELTPTAGTPSAYAVESSGAGFVTVRFDSLPDEELTLKADGLETAEILSGDQEPQLPTDFHDILVEAVMADELRKSEKVTLARDARDYAARRLSELRLFLAHMSVTPRQGSQPASGSAGRTGSGASTVPLSGLPSIAASRLLGRGSALGTGSPELITLGEGLEMSGTELRGAGFTTQTLDTSGTLNSIDLTARMTYLRWTGTADSVLTGLRVNGATPQNGDIVIVKNMSPFNAGNLRLATDDSGSAAEQRFYLPSNRGQIVATPGQVTMVYDEVASRWRYVNTSAEYPIPVAFSAGNFVGSGTVVWTVGSGDFSYLQFVQVGRWVDLNFTLDNTTVAGSGQYLKMLLPNSFACFNSTGSGYHNPFRYIDNGTLGIGMASVFAADTYLYLEKYDRTNWAASTNNTGVRGSIRFMVD